MKYKKLLISAWVWGFILIGLSTVWAESLEVPQQFKTISLALAAATAGDEVLVSPGTYHENLMLKKGVILRSRGNDEERKNFINASRTIIQSPGDGDQIVLGTDDAVLDGFTLNDRQSQFNPRKKRYGVYINKSTMTLTNCIIASLPYSGVGIIGATPEINIIKNNRIYKNMGNGITCEQGAKAQIEFCQIYLNEQSGIHNSTNVKVIIKHNTIRQNGIDGIMNSDRAEPVITENEIAGNGLNGVGLQRMSKGRVESNKIWGNKQAGIGIRMGAECVILNNTIMENLIGIGLMDIKQAVIEANKITGNYMVGIGLVRCRGGKVVIRKNDLRGNRLFPVSPNLACELIEEDNLK